MTSNQRTDQELIDQARKWPRGEVGEGEWFNAMADRMETMRAILKRIRVLSHDSKISDMAIEALSGERSAPETSGCTCPPEQDWHLTACPVMQEAVRLVRTARKHDGSSVKAAACPPFNAKLNASIEAVAKILQEEAASDPQFPVRGLANYAASAERIIRAVSPEKASGGPHICGADGCPGHPNYNFCCTALKAKGKAYFETHEPPHCPTCACGISAGDPTPLNDSPGERDAYTVNGSENVTISNKRESK